MEFEQILKLVDHVSASHLESFCYEGDGVKQEKKVSYMEKNIAFRNRLQIEKWRIKNFLQVRKNRLQIQ